MAFATGRAGTGHLGAASGRAGLPLQSRHDLPHATTRARDERRASAATRTGSSCSARDAITSAWAIRLAAGATITGDSIRAPWRGSH